MNFVNFLKIKLTTYHLLENHKHSRTFDGVRRSSLDAP